MLTSEILGDLKKEMKEGKPPPEERVKDFANKLFPMETVVNQHYKVLVKYDLLGENVTLDGRPNVGIKKKLVTSSGQKGFLIEETDEEKSIYKWKEGDFSVADRELSALWRMTTTNEDVLNRLKDSIKSKLPDRIRDFVELNEVVNNLLSYPDNQQSLLMTLMQNYEIHPSDGCSILLRWSAEGKRLISEFAKYAYHCLKVDALFLVGLANGLISTRPTNRVDLEYLYYLPFGNIFTSNDRVHKNLAPLLLRPYQRFISGTDLKQDLKSIEENLNNLEIEERKHFKKKPPIIETSITFQLWKEYFGYPTETKWEKEISDKEEVMMKEKMKEFELAVENDSLELNSMEDADFIVKKSYLGRNDPCYCGSGKRVIDCCIPEEKFASIAINKTPEHLD